MKQTICDVKGCTNNARYSMSIPRNIYRCGNSREDAEKVLDRVLNNPNNDDKFTSKGHFNIRLKEVDSSDCWWNDTWD